MLSPQNDGCYIFLFDTMYDAACYADYIQDTLEDAKELCQEEYSVDTWEEIPDPLEGCQDDWIAPVRVKGRNKGNNHWGQFEKLIDGEWKDISVEQKL